MPVLTAPSNKTYQKLLRSISQQITHSKRIIEQQTVSTYWTIGRSQFLQELNAVIEFIKRNN